jgi:hypothetical protein
VLAASIIKEMRMVYESVHPSTPHALLKKLIVIQIVKIHPAFYGTQRFIAMTGTGP